MRLSLRMQILLPLVTVSVLAVVSLSVWQALAASRRAEQRIEKRLRDVAGTLSHSNFPLTLSVLQHMRTLCGAELVLVDGGEVTRTDGLAPAVERMVGGGSRTDWQHVALDERVTVGNNDYFHAAIDVEGRNRSSGGAVLHFYYPETEYRRDMREAVLPPLLFGALAVLALCVCGWWVARHVSRVVSDLGRQVKRIAGGEFAPLPVPQRDDELRDLALDVNDMAGRLQDYESQIRQAEQMRTLGQLGAGLAHEMRNAATGARMAIGIHVEECPLAEAESLRVASTQLRLMESQLQRLLRLGREDRQSARQRVDMVRLLGELEFLLRSHARHLGVELISDLPGEAIFVMGDEEGLAQVFLNLLRNAIDASAAGDKSDSGRRLVRLAVEVWNATVDDAAVHGSDLRDVDLQTTDRLIVTITDSGPGPSDTVRDELFTPFVSDKADGVGLGLAVVRQVVAEHDGSVDWNRTDGLTHFVVQLPIVREETPLVAHSHR